MGLPNDPKVQWLKKEQSASKTQKVPKNLDHREVQDDLETALEGRVERYKCAAVADEREPEHTPQSQANLAEKRKGPGSS